MLATSIGSVKHKVFFCIQPTVRILFYFCSTFKTTFFLLKKNLLWLSSIHHQRENRYLHGSNYHLTNGYVVKECKVKTLSNIG